MTLHWRPGIGVPAIEGKSAKDGSLVQSSMWIETSIRDVVDRNVEEIAAVLGCDQNRSAVYRKALRDRLEEEGFLT